MPKPKYELRGRLAFIFSLSGVNLPLWPTSVKTLATIYHIYTQWAVPTQLQEVQVVKLIYVLVELILGSKGSNAFTLIVT